jgi:hypothetical protein
MWKYTRKETKEKAANKKEGKKERKKERDTTGDGKTRSFPDVSVRCPLYDHQ